MKHSVMLDHRHHSPRLPVLELPPREPVQEAVGSREVSSREGRNVEQGNATSKCVVKPRTLRGEK